MNKKYLALVLGAVMAMSMGMAAAAEEISTVAPGKLTVGTSPDFAPYEFYHIDEDGNPQLAGFDIALGNLIAEKLGLSRSGVAAMLKRTRSKLRAYLLMEGLCTIRNE